MTDLFRKIVTIDFNFEDIRNMGYSEDLVKFITRMLCKNKDHRYSAKKALKDKLITKHI